MRSNVGGQFIPFLQKPIIFINCPSFRCKYNIGIDSLFKISRKNPKLVKSKL